jgi:hypothetical protein
MSSNKPSDETIREGTTDVDGQAHVIPDRAVSPEQIAKYSPIRDPDLEQDIARYVEMEAQGETVRQVEKIKTEYILGDQYDIFDVTTDQGRWWVISNLTNLYPQKEFPSLDYTLSFHVGLMMRLRSRSRGADSEEPTPFDEVFRRQEQAKQRYDSAVEAEDYQAVGMQLRECLLSLVVASRRRIELDESARELVLTQRLKDADFKGWTNVLISQLCRGRSNKILRQYLKTTADKTWELANSLTHDRNATETSASIAIHACDTIIGHFVQLVERDETDNVEKCPNCKSRHIRSHFDASLPPEGEYYTTCGSCGWSSHPGADEDQE